MARGQENKKIVDDFLKEITTSIEFMQTMIPCIIPENEEDEKLLKQGLIAMNQIHSFIKECGGNLGYLDEMFDIDLIIKDYPKIQSMFSMVNSGDMDMDDIARKYNLGDEYE